MNEFHVMAQACVDEITKIAQQKQAARLPLLGALAAGGALALLANRANKDRKLGRQLRMQGQGY